MNGNPLNVAHGGPLRLIVPGYFGCNNIKYVKKLAATLETSKAKIMESGYRFRDIGESGDSSQPSLWKMSVNSWIVSPAGDKQVLNGKHQVHGVAFSGGDGVSKVEYSQDGKSWQDTRFIGPDMGENAWRMFSFEADLKDGENSFFTRATDNAGNVQPENRVENHRGYAHNGWRDHGVTLVAASVITEVQEEEVKAVAAPVPTPGSIELSEEAQAGRKLFVSDAAPPCGACHTTGEAGTVGAVGPNFDVLKPNRAQVESAVRQGVGIMPSFESSLTPEQVKSIATYILEVTGG